MLQLGCGDHRLALQVSAPDQHQRTQEAAGPNGAFYRITPAQLFQRL